jgi:hypothetical protein
VLPNEVPDALFENPEIADARDFKVSAYYNPEFYSYLCHRLLFQVH